MPLLRRANENAETVWLPVPAATWRWESGKPEIVIHESYGLRVKFPLSLPEEERARLQKEYPMEYAKDLEGAQQSWRVSYTVGLSMGWVDRTGQYKSTKLIDMLAALLGQENARNFRKWIAEGGGPLRPDDKDDDVEERRLIQDWLGWWEGLQCYGTISHDVNKQTGITWARFGGPIAIGSLPGQKDPEYQAMCRGKLKIMMAEGNGAPSIRDAQKPDKPDVRFDSNGTQVEEEDPPF